MAMFSVLIATYNRSGLLQKAIGSVLSQSYSDFEIIVSDDCSSDNTTEVMKSLCKADRRIKYYRNDNNLGSVANSKKMVMEYAAGNYSMYLCDDDYLIDNDFFADAEEMLADKNINYFTACADIVDTGGNFIRSNCHGLETGVYSGRGLLLTKKLFLSFNSVFMKTDYLKNVYSNVSDDNLSSDAELVLIAHAEGDAAYLDKSVSCWVQSDDSHGFAVMEKEPEKLLRSIDGYWKARRYFKGSELKKYDELHFLPKFSEIVFKLIAAGFSGTKITEMFAERFSEMKEYIEGYSIEDISLNADLAVFGYGFIGSIICSAMDKLNISYKIIDDFYEYASAKLCDIKSREFKYCIISVTDEKIIDKIILEIRNKNIEPVLYYRFAFMLLNF